MPLLTRICKHNLNLREGSRGKCFGVRIKNSSKYVTVGRSGFKKSLAISDNVKASLRRLLTHGPQGRLSPPPLLYFVYFNTNVALLFGTFNYKYMKSKSIE